jgi:peptidoglycan/LPS O-acetylase OafA/YrhL
MPKTLKTAARAVAALLVVFYHCFVIFDQPIGFERRFL